MKNEAPSMALPVTKGMLRLRLFCLLLPLLFAALPIAFPYKRQVAHWQLAGSFPIAVVCGPFA